MITEEQARGLKPGDVISFGTPGFYKVLSVSPTGETLTVDTVRDDGTRVGITLTDLASAELAGRAEPALEKKPESDTDASTPPSRSRPRG